MAKILNFNINSITACCNAINNGELVSFPTETVYGLGANALNEVAVDKIFQAKKRPKSDPLIVHIGELSDAYSLTNMTSFQKECFQILGNKFWPGPLTLIVNSAVTVPNNVTSNSGYIGIRIPNHPVALELLKQSKLPIAAPSANIFGHVSPTTAEHVLVDLGYLSDLLILNSDIKCQIGIESTIIKINAEDEIFLLRPGNINIIQIQNELILNGINTTLKKKNKILSINNKNEIESSGQFLTHYSPSIESFILDLSKNSIHKKIDDNLISQSILIDFNGKSRILKNKVLEYYDLSNTGNCYEAGFNLFSVLRKAEMNNKAKCILMPDFSNIENENNSALFDRIFRAASGKYISI